MNDTKKNAIVLFAKAPVAGKVKTRLQPELSPENSARLQGALIKDIISTMRRVKNTDKFIYFWPDENRNIFEKLIGDLPFQLKSQCGNNLGERMENSFRDLFNINFSRVVIIGADSPALPVGYIERAFAELNNSELVLGPSVDGGYYLIGLREKVFPVFSSVEWGSNKVLSQTEELIKKSNIKLSLLPVYYDVDTIEDLRFLKTHLRLLLNSGKEIPVNTGNIIEDILN